MTASETESPLGKPSDYPSTYSPELLFAIDRARNRGALGIEGDLPFFGTDIWNAWELTWLAQSGQPQVAECEIRVPAASPNIVESKSLKLYLNAFSMSSFSSADEVAATIRSDLSACTGGDVLVHLRQPADTPLPEIAAAPGDSLDNADVHCEKWEVDPELLSADASQRVSETLHSHLLRSLCPVTNQPDSGTLLLNYAGPRIDRAGLLRYIVSYRMHNDFHESCVERMFLDLRQHCGCESLSVYARYQRRGGIDINPYRSSDSAPVENLRLWRQ